MECEFERLLILWKKESLFIVRHISLEERESCYVRNPDRRSSYQLVEAGYWPILRRHASVRSRIALLNLT